MSERASLYDLDFYAWAQDQAARLRDWPRDLLPNGIDVANLVEEVEDLGKNEARGLESLLRHLFLHLLELEFHPHQRSRRGWAKEVEAARLNIARIGGGRRGHGSPKLWSERHDWARDAWADAVQLLESELRIDGAADLDVVRTELASTGAEPRYPLDALALQRGWFPPFWRATP